MHRQGTPPVVLASLEVRHSRSIAPTRRVALGGSHLPSDPPPGFGGLLVAATVAAHLDAIDDEARDEVAALVTDLERGFRIAQPRLRYRLQVDTHGLVRTTHRLLADGQTMHLDIDDNDAPVAQILGALYAVAPLVRRQRSDVLRTVRRAMAWSGPANQGLLSFLTSGRDSGAGVLGLVSDPHGWARAVMGFDTAASPSRQDVVRRFRDLVRQAHPDHGGAEDTAGHRLADLSEARRILSG